MRVRQLLLGSVLAMLAALPLAAQVPVLSSIEGPYPAVQTSQPMIRIAGVTYGSGAVAYGPPGTPLVLSGSDFGPSGTVLFPGSAKGSTVPATVTNWSPTILFVTVPSSATTGLVSIVTNEAKTSNALPFIVTKGTYAGSCPASPPNSQLEITTSSLPNGKVSTSYSANLNASGGTPPYTWSLSSGTLPAGLSLSSSGSIAGTPTAGVSADSITVRAQDSRSQVTDAVLSLSVFIPQQTVYSYSVPSGGYAPNGNLLSYTDSVMGTWSFGYDDLNRLNTGTASSGPYNGYSVCMAYDSFGNRTEYSIQASCPSNPTLITYSSNNRVGGYSYDASGNVLNDGTNSYAYDGDGRLCAVQTNNTGSLVATAYLYDADGRRVAKGNITPNLSQPCNMATNGFQVTESYVLGQDGEQLTTINSSGWQRTNVYGAGKLLATYDTDGPYDGVGLHFHLTDPLGTRRVQTSDQGEPETYCQSLPYGDRLSCVGAQNAPASGDDATPLHFTGKERDTESGNDYFGARYYSSTLGRFMSPDPSQLVYADQTNPQSLNLYSYVRNNPLINTDPTGMECVWDDGSYDDQHDPDTGNDVDKNGRDISGSGDKKCTAAGGKWVDHSFFQNANNNGANLPDWSPDANSSTSPTSPLGLVNLVAGCTDTILSALNSATKGQGFTSADVTDNFYWGGAVNIDVTANNLSATQYGAVQQTRYASPGFFGGLLGIGPSVHLPAGPGNGSPSQDSPSTLPFSKQNGTVTTSVHIDSAQSNAAHPIGAAIHGSVDVAGAATRNPCP